MSTAEHKVGFIGAGNMATALIKGIVDSALYPAEKIGAFDLDKDKLASINTAYNVKGAESNKELVKDCSTIVLAVKPQVMSAVLEDIKGTVTPGHVVISIAAGIKIAAIQSVLGEDIPVIRVMPNTPALIQKGVSALAAGSTVTDDQMKIALDILKAVGTTFTVEESMIDAVTAVSGSGPGFAFKIMECFVEAAEKQGFDRKTATQMVIGTFLGASMLAESSDLSLADLRIMVTSPGGTTEAGLNYMNDNRIAEIIDGTIAAAKDKSVELGKKK